jgi:nicotinate (nicotinamide) nucleotide adenylyltransferase
MNREHKRTILLFGLSANPPTGFGGHAGIVRWAAIEARITFPREEGPPETVAPDEVWVLPVYQHPFTEKQRMPSFEHRLRMAHLAFDDLPGAEGRVFIKDTERTVHLLAESGSGMRSAHGLIGTVDVVRYLMKEHTDARFALLLGQDTYRDLAGGKWKDSRVLLDLAPIVVIARDGLALEGERGVTFAVVPGLTNVSSSRVRASRDRAYRVQALQPEVLSYIETHHLYGPQDSP